MQRFRWSGWPLRRGVNRPRRSLSLLATGVLLAVGFLAAPSWAAMPRMTIAYQPMTGAGLAAGQPFEAWLVLDASLNPAVPGYALPAGAMFRFTFAPAFTPEPELHPEAVLLYGWPQKAAPVPFTVGVDPGDPRTIVLRLDAPFPAEPPERPGLKAIHLRMGPRNPAQAGDYPLAIQLVDAGPLSGGTQAIAHITAGPVPLIAAYNQLHDGRDEDWQTVKRGTIPALPLDWLVTLPGEARAAIRLRPSATGDLEILRDGRPIGSIRPHGVPVTLAPVPFGPGFARLGIVRVQVTAGTVPGVAAIEGQLQGGPPYTLHVIVTD